VLGWWLVGGWVVDVIRVFPLLSSTRFDTEPITNPIPPPGGVFEEAVAMAALFLPPPLDIAETVRGGSPQVSLDCRLDCLICFVNADPHHTHILLAEATRIELAQTRHTHYALKHRHKHMTHSLLTLPAGHRQRLAGRQPEPPDLPRGVPSGQPPLAAAGGRPRQQQLCQCERGAGR
jgi:hypothetical protein